MSTLAITGMGVVAATGVGHQALVKALEDTTSADALTEGSFATRRRELASFDVRAELGRKGTSSLDRGTAITLVACREALADSALPIERPRHTRIGVSVGTTAGSLRSMSDYTRATLVEARPYLVNPMLFPNTVINCTAGQLAIRHGVRGANSTLAGGKVALFAVMRYSERAIRLGQLDAVLAGTVEELSPYDSDPCTARIPPGEGAVLLVLERIAIARAEGRHIDAVLGATVSGFCPGGERSREFADRLARCLRQALDRAGVMPSEVRLIAWCAPAGSVPPDIGERVAGAVLGDASPERISVTRGTGDCGAAASALHIAVILCRHRDEPSRDGQASLVFGWTHDGALAALVLRGYSRSTEEHR